MSLERYVYRLCRQSAVYWEHTGVDGFSNPKFDSPVEVLVRWVDNIEVATDSQGKEFVSGAQILTRQNLKELSYIYLGRLADLPDNPQARNIEDAYEIRRMDRHPTLFSERFKIFVAYV